MERNWLRLAVLVVLLVTTGVVAADIVGKPLLDATLQTDAVSPGEETTLALTIVNNGSVEQGSLQNPALTQRVTTARGLRIVVDREDEVPLEVRAGTLTVGSLPEGGAAPLEVPISVDDDARPGRYRLPINLSYRYTSEIEDDGTEENENVTQTLHVPLRIEGAPRFVVRDVATDLRVASSETVSITVENVGRATAYETTLSLESPNADLGFGASPSSTRFVGTWPAGETRTVEFELAATDSATAQEYPLFLSATFEDEDGVPGQSSTRRLSVRPRPEGTFAVGNVSSTLAVGEEGQLVGTLTNTGEDPVENVVVVFTDQRATITPIETEAPVGDLDGGDTAQFSFPIEISGDAAAGPRQFAVRTRYRTAAGDLRQSDTIDVRATVGQQSPAFGVDAPGATIAPGEAGRLNVTVTNNGQQAYSDISAKLFAESPLGTTDDEAFIPELAPGQSAEVTFAVSATGSALEKAYPVSIDFRYDDADGDTLTSDTYRLAVSVVEPTESGGPPYLLLGVGVVVVLAVVLYYYRYRR